MQIFTYQNGQRQGPLSFEEVRTKASAGFLGPTDLVWYEGCTQWIPLAQIPGVFPPKAAPATTALTPPIPLLTSEVSQIRPWVRYWARIIDLFLFSVCFGLVASIFAGRALNRVDVLRLGLLSDFLWCFVEAGFLAIWGYTPAKAFFKISVRNSNGAKLDYKSALSRAFDVWFRGLAMGIPLIALFTMTTAYRTLTKKGITTWDQRRNFHVSHRKIGLLRATLAILFISLFIIAALLVGISSEEE
jgi:hypothetical protein